MDALNTGVNVTTETMSLAKGHTHGVSGGQGGHCVWYAHMLAIAFVDTFVITRDDRYDFGTAYVGDCTKINHPVAMAEPRHFSETRAVVDSILEHFPNTPAIFFPESDEVRGMNRDSRSAASGLSNAELLALDMNR